MRKSSKIALGALIVGIALFVIDLPLGNHGWEKTTGSVLFSLSALAIVVALAAGIRTLVTRPRAVAK
jgi:hypothetical protein